MDKPELKGPCEIWPKYIGQNGYGQLKRDGRVQNAHAYFYEQKYGIVPLGRVLDHLCGNRACVNPDHLEVVIHALNVRRGGCTKLTPEQVEEIRGTFVPRENARALAVKYGVTMRHIHHIVAGLSWKPLNECKLTTMRKNRYA